MGGGGGCGAVGRCFFGGGGLNRWWGFCACSVDN